MRQSFTVILALLILFANPCGADSAREILDRAQNLDRTTRHWTDRSEKLTLIITDARGGERHRELKVFTKRYGDDEEKALSVFLSPAEVRGTAFLQWGHEKGADEQWLYVPDLKRTRRITSDLSNENFMGTDFSYRDLGILAEIHGWTEDHASSTLVGEETVDGRPCYVIALRPKPEETAYGRIQLWLDKDTLVSRRMDFFEK